MAYSSDEEPGGLTVLTSLATDDTFIVGDTSDASEAAKVITKANLMTDLGISLTPGSIPFAGASGTFTQDNSNLTFDDTNNQLQIGVTTAGTGNPQFGIEIGGAVNDFYGLEIQNTSTGDSASTDISISADNDGASLVGHYIDVGIEGSGFVASAIGNVKSVSVSAGGTGYSVGNVLTLTGGDNNCTVTVATVSVGVVTSVTLTDNGTGYSVASSLATTGGGGSGCTINVLTLIDTTLYAAGDGYTYVSGGNLILGTDDGVAGKVIKFHTNGTATASERMRITDTQVTVGLAGSTLGKVAFSGNTSGTTTVQPAAAASGTLTLPAATDTLIGRATTDTLTNKNLTSTTNSFTAASTTQSGVAEASIASEVNTGTDAARYVSPDSLAGSNFGIRYVACDLNGTTALTTSEKCYFRIPAGMTGMNLVSVTGSVGTGAAGSSSSGTPTFTVRNVTDNNQMLSTSLTIDVSEYTSATAATPVVINTSFDDVVTDDLIEVAVTTAGTGVTYARVTLGFQLP